MSQRKSRKRSATISSCHCCDGESTCSAANSRTTQSGVSRVAANTSTVSTDTITSSGTFDNIMSSAGVNMDNISSLPNDSIITNCFATANESGSRTQKHSKHSKSRKNLRPHHQQQVQLLWSKVYQTRLRHIFNLVHVSGQLSAGKQGTISRL